MITRWNYALNRAEHVCDDCRVKTPEVRAEGETYLCLDCKKIRDRERFFANVAG